LQQCSGTDSIVRFVILKLREKVNMATEV